MVEKGQGEFHAHHTISDCRYYCWAFNPHLSEDFGLCGFSISHYWGSLLIALQFWNDELLKPSQNFSHRDPPLPVAISNPKSAKIWDPLARVYHHPPRKTRAPKMS